MDIKELGREKLKLDKELAEAIQPILNRFQQNSGLAPDRVHVFTETANCFVEDNPEAIHSSIFVKVSTEFRLG